MVEFIRDRDGCDVNELLRQYSISDTSSDYDDDDIDKIGPNVLTTSRTSRNMNRNNLEGDRKNILLLLLLYILQGIPLGLISAVPILIQNRGASYKQQAEFSLAYWPFSLKLFWAPIVDSYYNTKFGRRKSWLVPCQYLIGVFMLILSLYVDEMLDANDDGSSLPKLRLLTFIFFVLNFLAATQDIAVDGWALTMLKRCNVSYASTCNSVGQTAGYFLGYVVLIALESKDFCNKYIRSVPEDTGILTLTNFLQFWGICFLLVTTLVAYFKSEVTTTVSNNNIRGGAENEERVLNIRESFLLLRDMIKMPSIQQLALILLTVKVAFASCDAVTPLKLVDAGVSKDKLALLVVIILPLQIALPFSVSRYVNGPRPLDTYITAIPYRTYLAIFGTLIAYVTPRVISNGDLPLYFYIIIITHYAVYQIFLYCMFVSIMAFFARIADPRIGGTYMTFLNTLSNLGGNWSNTAALWIVDLLTWKSCAENKCTNIAERTATCATEVKDVCTVVIDGYYIESVLCFCYGVIWLHYMRKRILNVQDLPKWAWHVRSAHYTTNLYKSY